MSLTLGSHKRSTWSAPGEGTTPGGGAPESGRFKGLQGCPEGTKGEIGIPLSPLAPAERVPPPEAEAYFLLATGLSS